MGCILQESKKTDLVVEVDTSYKAPLRLVFKEINIIVAGSYKKNGLVYFRNVPIQSDATLMGFSKVNDQLYYGSKDIVINKNKRETLEMNETSLADLEQSILSLLN